MSGGATPAKSAREYALTIPNLITSVRLIAGPVCLYLLLLGAHWALWLALAVMIVAELSDMLDGMAARALGQVSDLGKLLDPLSDSVYRVAVFLAFVATGLMPAWMMLVILVRDLVVANVRVVAAARGETMAARTSGKIKAIVQAAAQIATVVIVAGFAGAAWASDAVWAVLLVATAVTAWSMVDYAGAVILRRGPDKAGTTEPQDTGLGWSPVLSLVRAALGVAAGVMIATGVAWAIEAAFVCLAVAVVADLADGTLPHRLGRSSQIEAFLDHTADTVIFAAVFVGLLAAGWMSVWAVLLVAAAEVTVPYLRNIGGQAARALEIGWPERLRTLAYAVGQLVIVALGAGLVSSTLRPDSIGWVLAAVAALFWAATLLECLRFARPGQTSP